MSKILFVDLETTGVDSRTNAVIEIACIVDIDGVAKSSYESFVMPFKSSRHSPRALEMHENPNFDDTKWIDPFRVYEEFTSYLSLYVDKFDRGDKFIFAAYNAKFDMDFLRAFFMNADKVSFGKYFGSYFFSMPMDIAALTVYFLQDKLGELENLKLSTVAKFCGLETEEKELHGAAYDISLARNLYHHLIGAGDDRGSCAIPTNTLSQKE